MNDKICHKCKIQKSKSDFYKNNSSKDGLDCYCKECRKKANRISDKLYLKTKKGKAKKRAYQKSINYRKSKDKYNKSEKGKLKIKQQKLKYYYGITTEHHKQAYLEQNGCCAICKKPIEYNKIHTDHDHKTEKFRGLLCIECNTRLGWYEKQEKNIKFYLKG